MCSEEDDFLSRMETEYHAALDAQRAFYVASRAADVHECLAHYLQRQGDVLGSRATCVMNMILTTPALGWQGALVQVRTIAHLAHRDELDDLKGFLESALVSVHVALTGHAASIPLAAVDDPACDDVDQFVESWRELWAEHDAKAAA